MIKAKQSLLLSNLSKGPASPAWLRRVAWPFIFCALTSGCSSVELFPWTQESSTDAVPTQVFNLPEKSTGPASQLTVTKLAFAREAPGYKLPRLRLEVNHEVRRELDTYLRNNGRCIRDGLARQQQLFPVLANILQDEGLPEELLNLALIESGFRAEAVSPAGAAGLWQFMNSTARIYGLEVSRKVDERRDPILSTMAAARHLKELYSKYNDWYLALAAYNAGNGSIDKVRTSRSDFWSLVRNRKISGETSRFVPKFIAASILQKLYVRYGANVELAQYLDRHLVNVASSGNERRFAFSMESEVATSRG